MTRARFVLALVIAACTAWAFDAGASAEAPRPPSLRPAPGFQIYPTREIAEQRAAARLAAAPVNVAYHGGPVMRAVTAYLIFWDPGDSMSAGYRSLIERYFRDIGGSDFYRVATQYYQVDWKLRPPQRQYITDRSTLGGVWTDRTPYPRPGTPEKPLRDSDLHDAIERAMDDNGWKAGMSSLFFVFTAEGVESCFFFVFCTPGTDFPTYCAYHSAFFDDGDMVIYANMPYAGTWDGSCRSFSQSPNGDIDADATISIASHEHFEAVTDPVFLGWWDSSLDEIADKCAYTYGAKAPDGSNLTLNGNPYILQLEWSNLQSACVKSLP